MQRMQKAPPSVRSIDPAIPEEIADLIDRCLQPDPAERFQTTDSLLEALTRLDVGGRTLPGASALDVRLSTAAPHVRRLGAPRGWQWAVGLAAAIAAAAALWWAPGLARPPVVDSAPVAQTVPAGLRRMALLPFAVTDDAGSLAHVAVGLREALSAKLVQLSQVSLAASSSVERRGSLQSGSIERIGRELGVNFIVSGTRANRQRVVFRLTSAWTTSMPAAEYGSGNTLGS